MDNTDKSPYIHDDSGSSPGLRLDLYCPICWGVLKPDYISHTFERIGHAEWCSRYDEPAEAE